MISIIIVQLCIIALFILSEYKKELAKVAFSSSILSAIIANVIFFAHIMTPTTSITKIGNFFSCSEFNILRDSLSISVTWIVCSVTTFIVCFLYGSIGQKSSNLLYKLHFLCLAIILEISSNNFLQIILMCEIVTYAINCLVKFDHTAESLAAAEEFSFSDRCGNLFLLLSLVMIFGLFKTSSLDILNTFIVMNDTTMHKIEVISGIMAVALIIKTSQIGVGNRILLTMQAPLPSTALIYIALFTHILTLLRLQNLIEYSEFVQNAMIIIGILSSILCAAKSAHARDLNSMLAFLYSSVFGLAIASYGLAAYGAVIILFVTYCFSGSLIILAISSVQHSLSHETSIEKMGGLFEKVPKAYIAFLCATASIINIPLLSSYYAKKELITEIIVTKSSVCYVLIFAIFIISVFTCISLFRIIYLVFHGKCKVEEIELAYINEDNKYITFALFGLIVFAVFSGVIFYYFAFNEIIWKDIFAMIYHYHVGYSVAAFFAINLIGIAGAVFMCKGIRPILFNHVQLVYVQHFFEKIYATIRTYSVSTIKMPPIVFALNYKSCFLLLFFILICYSVGRK